MLPPGRRDLAQVMNESGGVLGLLVVEGLVCSDAALTGRHLMEYLGPGDVIQVPAEEDDGLLIGDPSITVIERTVMVALGPASCGPRTAGRSCCSR